MVQLWVNLPAKDKMAAPGYQGILDAQIPALALPGDAGTLRLIAGEYAGQRGPARTFTPMNVWDLRLAAGQRLSLPQPEGWTTLLVVLDGTVQVNGEAIVRAAQMATLVHRRQRCGDRNQRRRQSCCCWPASRSTSRWWVTARS